jgi:tetratricopeptide (TPR) repeat protein
MSNDNQKNPLKNFTVRYLPWLLGAVMMLIYLTTLNPWVTLLNLGQVATVSGWVWQPQLSNPLQFLALLPFHLLPAGKIPFALNFFSAVCATFALVMLARSIAILPHDRTDTERQRERSDFSFLTGWVAFFPPVFAVILFGLQLTFWEHATSFTGESFELLLFAAVVWQLLEYRLDENPKRLYVASLIFGAGLAENWAFVGFFPVFIAAIIWLRKLDFFNLQFLARMFWCGLAGLFFFLLLPIVSKFSGTLHLNLWDALHQGLIPDWLVIKAVGSSYVWHKLALISLGTLLPVLVMSIRWSSNFGDSSQMGTALVNYLFYFVHAVFFGLCVWVMFDPPFSAHQISYSLPIPFFSAPALVLYYLSALSIGYYSGFFLLVFGKRPARSRRTNTRPDPALPEFLMWLCPVIVGGTFAFAAIAVGLLIYKNAPIVRAINGDSLMKYAQFTTQNLPPGGAIILSDSDGAQPGQFGRPLRAFLIQAMLAREGRGEKFPVVDTQSLNLTPYYKFLHQRFPDVWPEVFKQKEAGIVNEIGILGMLNLLAKSNNICYLNPSFGYYFESFYQEPHGLVYTMKLLPTDTLLPPPLDKNLIAENEKFWSEVAASVSPEIVHALTPPDPNRQLNLADQLLNRLHVVPEPNLNAIYAGAIYSRSLNFWGVKLQHAGELDLAATNFISALNLNPDNVTAGINLEFNQKLRAGTVPTIDTSRVNLDKFGNARSWNEILNADGPFDEPSFDYMLGLFFMQNSYNGQPMPLARQALAVFDRVRQLVPGSLDVRFQLAQVYVFNHLPDRALEILHDPLTEPGRFSLTESNSTGLNMLAAAAHFQKNENARGVKLLETEISRHPDDDTLITASVQAFMMHGLYTNALRVIDQKLAQTPDDPRWLFGKGYAELQTGDYDKATHTLTRVLEIQTNNPTALFNRALAYLDSDKLDSARADYTTLQTTYTNSFQIAFGLGEIAWRQHDTNEAIRNYEIYLANAKTNTAEATNVIERLRELKK